MVESNEESSGISDPRVRRLRPEPGTPPSGARAFYGFLGDSDRPGRLRIYLTRSLDSYAEFSADDVVYREPIAADRAPFVGEIATRVEVRGDAPVDIVRSSRAADVPTFDVAVRFRRLPIIMASDSGGLSHDPITLEAEPTDFENPCRTSLFAPPCDATFGPVPTGGGGGGGGGDTDGRTATVPAHTDVGMTQCGTCHTDIGFTQCGTCNTDIGFTQCGTCNTDIGFTQCGTCHTDIGQTECDDCRV